MGNIIIFILLGIIIILILDVKKSLNILKSKPLTETENVKKVESIHSDYLLKELAEIVQDIKLKVDIGLPTWKKEFPYYLEYGKHMMEFDGNWFYHLVLQSIKPCVQIALNSVGERLEEKKALTFTFKKKNDRNKINYLIIDYSYKSFLSLEEKVEGDDVNWNKFEGLCDTDMTEYSIYAHDADMESYNEHSSETIIMRKGFIEILYRYAESQKYIKIELDDKY